MLPANLALARFCSIASGSASELDYHLLLARDLHLIPSDVYTETERQLTQLRRMLNVFIQKLKANRQKPKANSQPPTPNS